MVERARCNEEQVQLQDGGKVPRRTDGREVLNDVLVFCTLVEVAEIVARGIRVQSLEHSQIAIVDSELNGRPANGLIVLAGPSAEVRDRRMGIGTRPEA